MAAPVTNPLRTRRDAVQAAPATFYNCRYEAPAVNAAAFPGFWLEEIARHHAATAVIIECRFGGTHPGAWAGIEAADRQIAMQAACKFVFELVE